MFLCMSNPQEGFVSVPNFQYKMECSFSAPKRGRASPAEDSPPPPAKMPAGAPDDAVNTDLDTDQALSPGPAAKVPLVVSTSYEAAIFGDDDSPVHCSPGHSVSDLSDLVNGVLNPGPSRHVHDSPSSVRAVHAGGLFVDQEQSHLHRAWHRGAP